MYVIDDVSVYFFLAHPVFLVMNLRHAHGDNQLRSHCDNFIRGRYKEHLIIS